MQIIDTNFTYYKNMLPSYYRICKAYKKSTLEVDDYLVDYAIKYNITFIEAFEELSLVAEDLEADNFYKLFN